ncbi:hypothetical protein EJ02DRAFT_56368 [Clathrospora elynae]|uniref:Uncharacterized protein n=1 Tax=Clathrospora elynae TaxID=706981 RepID=A0A6A5SBM9_9PLEO|nr:hypothetical protein EJ02DRAFT_56368 [Clathrospora elynae]
MRRSTLPCLKSTSHRLIFWPRMLKGEWEGWIIFTLTLLRMAPRCFLEHTQELEIHFGAGDGGCVSLDKWHDIFAKQAQYNNNDCPVRRSTSRPSTHRISKLSAH